MPTSDMISDITSLMDEIEPLAVTAWPAREIVRRDGWQLRFTSGSSHRGNSVVTLSYDGDDLGASVAAAEAEYRRRGLVPMFHVTAASRPRQLEAELLARAYRRISPTHVCVARTDDVLSRLAAADSVVFCDIAEPRFRELVTAGSRSAIDGAERLEILGRLSVPHVCALALTDDMAVACGVGVETQGWVSFYVMRSHARARRRGHARRVLAAIAAWAQQRGAARLFLQVEDDNLTARTLYQSAGFVPAYPYRYYVPG